MKKPVEDINGLGIVSLEIDEYFKRHGSLQKEKVKSSIAADSDCIEYLR